MRRHFAIALLSLSTAIGPVEANTGFQPIGEAHRFVFDTSDGRYTEWDIHIVCPNNALRATVHLSRYGKPTTQYEPGVNVYLVNGGGEGDEFGKLGFHATAFRAPFLVTMSAGDAKGAHKRLTFARQTGDKDWFSFELRWTDDGAVQGYVDGQSGVVTMVGAPDRIRILGFSGAGEIVVQLGHVRSEAHRDPCRPVA